MELREKTIGSEVVFKGKVLTVKKKEVLLPDGSTSTREVVVHPGAVAVVALDEENHLYLVEQYRSPLERTLLELPAGKLDAGENPKDCASRELAEEIGKAPEELTLLSSIYVSPGYTDEKIHIFLATALRDVPKIDVPGEFLTVKRIPLALLPALIEEGKIEDGKTLLGVCLALNKLQV